MENLGNDYATTLNGAIDSSQLTLVVTSATGAPEANFRIRIDNEYMLVTAKAGTTFTVTRSVEGSSPASHSNGATLAHVLTKAGVETWSRDQGQIVRGDVPDLDTLVVPAGHQFIVGSGYTVSGVLQLDGDLMVVG